ncbi:MAG: DUF3892 domain-containing protein [Candidatus Berkiella sp.]
MTKREKIIGNQDGPNGRNETYLVGGKTISRDKLVKQVEQGKYPGYHVMERDGEKYVRDNPDSSKSDNVNKP